MLNAVTLCNKICSQYKIFDFLRQKSCPV